MNTHAFAATLLATSLVLLGEVAHARADQVARPLTGAKPVASTTCQDSDGGAYSAGALVQVHGRLMRCVIGPHWEPFDAAPSPSSPTILDVTGENISEAQETSIVEALKGPPLPALECDTVLNSDLPPQQLLRVPPGGKLVLNFWTPTCGPCKPLLAELAALADAKPGNLAIIGVVQSADPESEPPGEWQLLRVKGLLAQYKVRFPTCLHMSRELTHRWQAGGTPLTLLISDKGVERAALGAKNGHQLLHELTTSR